MEKLYNLLENSVIVLPETKFFEINNGVIIHNKTNEIRIKGKFTYQLIVWLYKKLDGMTPLKYYLPPLEHNKTIKILNLIHLLINNNFAKQIIRLREKEDNELIDKNPMVYKFLCTITNNPFELLKKIQQQKFICLGYGVALRNLLSNLLVVGARNILVICDRENRSKIRSCIYNFEAESKDIEWIDCENVAMFNNLTQINSMLSSTNNNTIILVAHDNLKNEIHNETILSNFLLNKKIHGITFISNNHAYAITNFAEISYKQVLTKINIPYDGIVNYLSPVAISMPLNIPLSV